MRPDAKVAQQLERLETVEWLYDGLGGKVIAWTKAHGGTSDDPSGQAFLVARDGTVQSRCPDAAVHAAGSFEVWLKEQADLYEKQHPRTRLALLPASVKVEGEGETRKVSCPALDEARAAKTPVLLYVGRDSVGGESAPDSVRALRAEVEAARKFERSTLDSKAAADVAAGWVLLRLDLADADQAAFAAALGADKAPALLLFAPSEEQPQALDRAITGAGLAFLLKKHAPPAPR